MHRASDVDVDLLVSLVQAEVVDVQRSLYTGVVDQAGPRRSLIELPISLRLALELTSPFPGVP